MYRYLSTSRGAGNSTGVEGSSTTGFVGIDTYLPREGTETILVQALVLLLQHVGIATYQPREGPETV